MNIESLLRQFLYQHRSISFPGIGKISFAAGTQLPDDHEKEGSFPLQGLEFQFDLQEGLDNELVAFVSSQTGKIKPLAAADIDSFFLLSKQFINIGKAFTIDGIGSIIKRDDGTYAFTPGHYVAYSEADLNAVNKPLKIREAQPVIPKEQEEDTRPAVNKKAVIGIIVILLIGLAGWAIYHFLMSGPSTEQQQPAVNVTTEKDTAVTKPAIDTTIKTVDSTVVSAKGFRAIIDQRATRVAAEARAAKLRGFGHNVMIDSAGPALFKIYVPLKDTTISIDTLQLKKINGKKPLIEVVR